MQAHTPSQFIQSAQNKKFSGKKISVGKKTIISIIVVIAALALISGVVLLYKEKTTETEKPTPVTTPNKSSISVPSESQTMPTETKRNLPVPDAPYLSFLIGAKSFVQINWNWKIADYFNVYRAIDPNGPWEKIITNFPQSAHTAVDYNLPRDAEILYYRITSVDKEGNESRPSETSSVKISPE